MAFVNTPLEQSKLDGDLSQGLFEGMDRHGHEQVVKTCRDSLKLAQDADDESSAALIGDRMRVHEKTAWMLRAMLPR